MANKLIPIKAIKPLIKSNVSIVHIDKLGEDVEVIIKNTLSLEEMFYFINNVSSRVADFDSGLYLPEVIDFLIDANILCVYANFKMPSNINDVYSFISNNQDIVNTVKEYINEKQLSDIINAINNKISYISNSMSSIAMAQMSEAIAKISMFIENNEAIFEGVDAGSIGTVMDNLSKLSNADETELVRAILDK